MIRIALLALVAVAALATLPEPSAAASCGNISQNTGRITTNGVGCSTGRTVARQWETQCASQPDGSCRVSAGFYCRFRSLGHEAATIRCTRGRKVVRFYTGA